MDSGWKKKEGPWEGLDRVEERGNYVVMFKLNIYNKIIQHPLTHLLSLSIHVCIIYILLTF